MNLTGPLRVALLAGLLTVGCATGGRAGGDAQSATLLQAQAKAFIDHRLQKRPVWATEMGVHTYDAQLDDWSPAARAQELAWLDAFAAGLLKTVHRDRLGLEDQADYDVLLGQVNADRLQLRERHVFELNPAQWLRLASQAVHALMLRDFAPLPDRLRSVTARLNAWPELFTQARASLARPPRIWTEVALEQVEGMDGLLRTQLPEAFAPVEDAELQAAFQQAQARAREALTNFTFYLRDEVLPQSTGNFALGPELFSRMLEAEEGIREPPEALWTWGDEELRRTQQAFAEAAHRVDPLHTPAEVFQALAENHPPAGELLANAEGTVADVRRFVEARQLVTIPTETHLKVAETPRFAAALSFASLDEPGPLETHALDAFYYITLPGSGWPAARARQHLGFYNRSALPVVTAHEVYPGHYVQRLHSREVPSLVRRLFGSTSFTEGWGLYAEQLLVDEGYGDDPATRAKIQLAQLGMYLQRLARYRVSLGLHTRGMSYPAAVSLFEDEAHMTQANAEREARRGTMDPLYLDYALGRRELLKLRDEVKLRQGGRFSLKAFHDQLLSYGQPPVPVARRLMLGE